MLLVQAVAHESAIDVLAFETIPCAKELQAIEQILRIEVGPAPAWVSVSSKDSTHISQGEDYAAACLPLLTSCKQIVAVGFNCTAPRYVTPLLNKARYLSAFLTVAHMLAACQQGPCAA